MKNNKYKILVLSDLKKSTSTTLKTAVSLAKMIDGEIEFFHVKKPIDIVEKENQLSAMRTINENHTLIRKKIKKLAESISEEYDVEISHSFAFGNIKNEISKHIQSVKPDIIVLGKKSKKSISLVGDNLTNFVISEHDGIILLASPKNSFEPNKELSLGVLNNSDKSFSLDFPQNLLEHTQKPLKSFKIISKSDVLNKTNENLDNNKNTVEYVFEESDNALKTMSNYLLKNNINLLCFDREGKANTYSTKTNIKEVIKNLNLSLLLTNKQN
jgi:nucleotide-binding universal stress UspA family protein